MIENELKYVLKDDARKVIEKNCGKPMMLRQGYLPGKARIRSKSKVGSKKEKYFFTYKLPVEDVLFEIEKEIAAHEFDVLWPHTTKRLNKLRYMYVDGDVQWDIDFFLRQDGSIYFAMAEAEMPEEMRTPSRIPNFIKSVLVYKVPRDRTKEFTSQKVADPDYAAGLSY